MLSFPSWERFAASAKRAKETRIQQHRQVEGPASTFQPMASTAGESITPGYASSARPGVWLTDLSLVFVAFVWGVNFSIVKFGTTLVAPLAYNGLRIALAAVVLSIIVAVGRSPLPPRSTIVALLGLGVLGNGVYQFLFVEGIAHTRA